MTQAPATAAVSKVLAAGLLALTLLFDPFWLDFEAARRGALFALLGLLLLARPSLAQVRRSQLPLLLLVSLFGLQVLFGNPQDPAAGILRTSWWLAVLGLASLPSLPQQGLARLCCALLGAAFVMALWQWAGLPACLGTASEPVSLFGNRNVAAEFVAVACACLVACRSAAPRLWPWALATAGLHLALNGSRSALVALPAALAYLMAVEAGSWGRRLAPLATLGAGLAAGFMLHWMAAPADAASPAAAARLRKTETLEVRWQIANGSLDLCAEAPWFGHGPGAFEIEYPRHRSQREIELSSLQRQQMRRVESAHDDWLETAVEGGIAGLLLLVWFFVARWRELAQPSLAAPLVALALLMLVRSPWLSAPTVALALLASGTTGGIASAGSPRRTATLRVAAVCMLMLGLWLLAAHWLVARHLQQRLHGSDAAPVRLEQAARLWPWDPSVNQLLAQERQQGARTMADMEQALAAAGQAVALRPHEPSYRLLLADLLRLCGKTQQAKAQLAEVARLDPGEPQVQVQLAGIYLTEGDFDAALIALLTAPPPALRGRLHEVLVQVAQDARARGEAANAQKAEAEAAFVAVLDALDDPSLPGLTLAREQLQTFQMAQRQAGASTDLRTLMLLSILALRAGDADGASAAGTAAKSRALPLPAWQWSLLRAYAEPLRAIEAWATLLPKA